MAIRVAIGASRLRLVTQLLTEGLVVGLAGGVVGVLMASLAVRQIVAFSLPLNVPFNLAVSLDLRVLAFACMASVGATLLFSLIPAWEASRPNLVPFLKGEANTVLRGAKGRAAKRVRGRNQLVVLQCAASLVLIVGAALFLRTLQEATAMDLGFSTQGVAVMTKSLPGPEYSPEEGIETYRALRERLSALPGVASAQLSRSLELTLFQAGAEATVHGDGLGAEVGEGERILRNSVTPGYLEMLQIPLLRGRTLREDDGVGSPLVAVVNETFAQRFWPGEDPVGRRFRISDADGWLGETENEEVWLTVVGMVKNGTYEDFDDGVLPYFWTSLFQDYAPTVAVSLKGAGEAEEMLPLLRDHVELAPGEVPLVFPSTLEGQVSIQFIHLRIASDLLGWGGVFGLILAVIGIYGIVTMAVTERTREMAIRLALGADGNEVVRRVAWKGTNLALVGLVVGLLIGLPLAHLLRGLFYGVGALDPWALGGGISVMVLAALVASVVPALRVTRIDPMTVLREE
jgi:predicted permease